jgi:tetratricopeptide (TPR) repeat protein
VSQEELTIAHIRRLIATGDLTAAAGHSVTLVQQHPKDAHAWQLAADVALRSGKDTDAAQFLSEAVACAPEEPTVLIQYAQCLLKLGRRRDALAIASRAQALELGTSGLLDALGTLWTHLEEPLRGLPLFRLAVEREPESVDFRYNLAMAQRMAGELEAAEANLDKVIDARPDDGEAYHARSDLRKQTPQRNHVSQLEHALSRSRGVRPSLPIRFALAKELEDLGQYSRSLAQLHAACKSYRAALRYDVAADIAVLDKLRTVHTNETIANLRSELENEECIFVVGLPRSGTTLVERILGSHSEVYPAGELDVFPRVAIEAVGRRGNASIKKLDFVERALEVDFSRLGSEYLHGTRPRTGDTARFTDKLPLNYLYAGIIHAALPRARFVAVHRHPMDVCYAMYKTLFAAAYPFSYDLNDLARYYVAWNKLMEHWANVIGDAWLPVRYEDLITDREIVSRHLIKHCGLIWEESCLDFHTQAAAVTTASAVQVRRPLYSDSVGRWRHYAQHLEPVAQYFEAHGISVR